jgi:hypothetical protein
LSNVLLLPRGRFQYAYRGSLIEHNDVSKTVADTNTNLKSYSNSRTLCGAPRYVVSVRTGLVRIDRGGLFGGRAAILAWSITGKTLIEIIYNSQAHAHTSYQTIHNNDCRYLSRRK